MPSVKIAMERSLQPSVADRFMALLSASLEPVVGRRDVVADAQNQISDVKTAFSSWDNCMNAVYCKWPVIAIIVVGGLFLLSIVWCISRCLCCGLSCCCECCYCLKCCGNCCGCCDPPRGKKHKYLDEPFVPPHHAAYKSHEPMVAPAAAPTPFSPGPFPPARSEHTAPASIPPQYAEFDVSKKTAPGHEDALPVMPTWESAGSKKVLVEEEEMEMNQLKKPEASNANNAGQNVPLMTGASAIPGPVSPIPSPDHRSPYSPPGAAGANGGYMGAGAAAAADPYGAQGRGYNNYNTPNGAYGQSQTSLGTDQGYGMPGAAMAAGAGRRSPGYNNPNTAYNQVPQTQTPYSDSYGQPQDQGYPPQQNQQQQHRPTMPGAWNSYNTQQSYDSYNTAPQGVGYARGGGGQQGMRSPPPRMGNASIPPAGTAPQPYPQERLGRTPPPRQNTYGGAERTYSPAPMMPQQQQRQVYHELPSPTM
ncbi:hypothetical protein GE09DRAFT_910403, partial [Coniochaeta sp. 2T2.1]